MPEYTVETTYRLPVYRHGTYQAATVEDACRLALEDDDWDGDHRDYDSAGETYVTGVWIGADPAYQGNAEPVPSHFDETVHRKAKHFDAMLAALTTIIRAADHSKPPLPGFARVPSCRQDWDPGGTDGLRPALDLARAVVATAHAIRTGQPDPDELRS